VSNPGSQKSQTCEPLRPGQFPLCGQKLPALLLQLQGPLDHLLLQVLLQTAHFKGHLVELVRQEADLVTAGAADRLDPLPCGHPPGSLRQRPHRHGQPPADPAGNDDTDAGHQQKNPGKDQVETPAHLQERPLRHTHIEGADYPAARIPERLIGRNEPVAQDKRPVTPALPLLQHYPRHLPGHERADGPPAGSVAHIGGNTHVAQENSSRPATFAIEDGPGYRINHPAVAVQHQPRLQYPQNPAVNRANR